MKILINLIFLFATLNLAAQAPSNFLLYSLKGFTGEQAVLFSIKGSETVAIDTVQKQSTGTFVFHNIEQYPAGMYSVYFNDSLYTELIFNKEDIIVETEVGDIVKNMQIRKSLENQILFDYWNFALEIRDSVTLLSIQKANLEKSKNATDYIKIKNIEKKILRYNSEIYQYVKTMNIDYRDYFAPKLLKSYIVPSFEEYQLDNPENKYEDEQQFYFEHFFDNIDFSDARFLNTKVIFVSLSDYMKAFGTPASTKNYIEIIDQVMDKAYANREVYNYCLDLFIQTFENSLWEEVFVHLIDHYYLTSYVANPEMGAYYAGLSARIKALKPGKLAPEILLQDTLGNIVNLHNTKAKAKIIVFYSSDCSHCAEALPSIIETYDMYKELGVEGFGICIDDNLNSWKKEINKFNMNWVNLSDLKGTQSPILQTYNITSTPTIIILNENNIIMDKPKNINDIHATLVQVLNL